MHRRFAWPLLLILIAAALTAGGAVAQSGEGKSRFVRFLERLVSTPERQVSLSGLKGAFSAHPTVERIEIADREGVWLVLDGVEVVWNRSALLDRLLDINVLRAESVSVLRKPLAAEGAKPGGGISAPPVAIAIGALALPKITIAAPVVGTEANLSASGSAVLTEDVVAAQLSVDRQDQPGKLAADLHLEPEKNIFAANVTLSEPAGGLAAGLLGLRGAPAITMSLSGQGPLDHWQAALDMQAGETRVLSGAMSIARLAAGYQIRGALAASLEQLAPERYAPLLAGDSRLDFDLTRNDDGSLALHASTLRSESLDMTASGVLAPDYFPQSAEVSLTLGRGGRVAVPLAPGEVSVANLRLTGALDAGNDAPWRVALVADGVEGAFGRLASLAFNASGQAHDLTDPGSRATSFHVDGATQGLAMSDARLAAAVGAAVKVSGDGSWTEGVPLDFDNLAFDLDGARANFAGAATGERFEGSFTAAAANLSRFAALAGRPLKGATDLTASGWVAASGLFDLKVDGTTTNLALGVAPLDPLLAAETHVTGGVARTDAGMRFDALTLTNDRANAKVDGTLADPEIDLSVEANVADLSLATPRAKGAATLSARVTGSRAAPKVEAEASGQDLVLMDRPLADAHATFSGIVAGPDTSGQAQISGTLGDSAVTGVARLAAGANGTRVVDGLRFAVGASQLTGSLTIAQDGLATGDFSLVSPDLSEVAPLFLAKAGGKLRAEIGLRAEDGAQSAKIAGTATDAVYENLTLESADIEGEVRDLFKAPDVAGKFSLRNLTTGGLAITSATGTASRRGEATVLDIDAKLADGNANLAGSLAPRENGIAIALQSFAYKRAGIDLTLAAPTEIVVAGGSAQFDKTLLSTGGGSIALSGTAGANLDLAVTLTSVPAALVNSFKPDLGAEGTISGTVTAKGTASAPNAEFKLTFADASVTSSRNAGLGPFGVSAEGSLAEKTLELKSHVTGAGNLSVDVTGSVGTAAGTPLDLRVAGSVPMALGNARLASRGAALEGALNVDIAVSGTALSPQFSGRVTSEGGGFVDPGTGIVLRGVQLAATVSGKSIAIEKLTAASGEGTVSASGTIGLDPNQGFPIDLAIQVQKARYVDGTLIAARFDADLKLTGRLSEGPLLEGPVTLDRAEVTIPEKLPRDSVAVDVEHVGAPKPVAQTLAIIRPPSRKDEGAGAEARPAAVRVNIAIHAAQRIFVRGRGLDTEFGGDLTLSGPMSALVASGGFDMVRGRLDILTQRISFDHGVITFAGDLDPLLEFSGSTRSGTTTITVTVSGRASDPEVAFSSVPELPQDEILAQLIFQKGIADLSPLQIARLAAAASELAGGSGGGILSRLRATTGLDDLDIVTDEKGQTSVAAGRYVSENVYVGVQQGATTDSSRVTIDLDVTKGVKARAGVSAEGDSSLGLFFEKEY